MSRERCSWGVATGAAFRVSSQTQVTARPAGSPCRTLRAALSGAVSATPQSRTTCASSRTACTKYASCASSAAKESARCAEQSSHPSTTAPQSPSKTNSSTANPRHNRQHHLLSPLHPLPHPHPHPLQQWQFRQITHQQ